MESRMSRWGVGPLFATLSIVYGLAAWGAGRTFHPLFEIGIVPHRLLTVLGVSLIAVGIPFYLVAVVAVMRAYNSDKLVTHGVYGFCRHPLYASWAVLIAPGVVLLIGTWLGLTVPVFMCLVLRRLVQSEEQYLQDVFV